MDFKIFRLISGLLIALDISSAHFFENCGGELYTESGQISTPQYPGNYPNNLDCIWIIHIPNDRQVALQFDFFEVISFTKLFLDYKKTKSS